MFSFTVSKKQARKLAGFAQMVAGMLGYPLSIMVRENDTLIQLGDREFTVTKRQSSETAAAVARWLSDRGVTCRVTINRDTCTVTSAS